MTFSVHPLWLTLVKVPLSVSLSVYCICNFECSWLYRIGRVKLIFFLLLGVLWLMNCCLGSFGFRCICSICLFFEVFLVPRSLFLYFYWLFLLEILIFNWFFRGSRECKLPWYVNWEEDRVSRELDWNSNFLKCFFF